MAGTVKKSTETMSFMWFCRNVFQVCEEDVLQIADPKQLQAFLFFSEINSDAGFTNSGWS